MNSAVRVSRSLSRAFYPPPGGRGTLAGVLRLSRLRPPFFNLPAGRPGIGAHSQAGQQRVQNFRQGLPSLVFALGRQALGIRAGKRGMNVDAFSKVTHRKVKPSGGDFQDVRELVGAFRNV